MSTDAKIRCHQFLGGRFHEGYGRTEVSREDDHGRRKTTIDYEGINLDGRNNFFFDGYRAYEIEPTHSDWKCPGVFCVTNGIENGSQAARTYGIIPASGKIEDAFSVLRREPELSLEEFSEYDHGRKILTWLDMDRTAPPVKKYVLTDAARERLGQFLYAYWSIMSIRMMEPDNHDVVALHLSFHIPEDRNLFQEQVDFFRQEVILRYPKAVQAMTSVAFGVPWTQRRMHPATSCIVTSDDKDLNANPIYSFDIQYVNGQYEVDAGRTYRGYGIGEKEGVIVSDALMGNRPLPRIYCNMENLFSNAEGGDHPILRSHEVMALLAQIDLSNERWINLPEAKKRNEARKYAQSCKRNYDVLYKTLMQNCRCSEEDTFQVLLPLLDDLLEIMGSIDEGTEFESVFNSTELPFFAGCRRLNESVAKHSSEGKRRNERINILLVDNYSEWSNLEFRCDLGKGPEDDDIILPKDMFLSISGAALSGNEGISETVVERTLSYCQKNFPEEIPAVSRSVFEWQGKHLFIDKAFYDKQREWLGESRIREEKTACMLMLPLADKLMADESAMRKVGVQFVGEHMDQLSGVLEALNESDRKRAESIIEREFDFLLKNFAEWRQEQHESRRGGKLLKDMVARWQKENLEESSQNTSELNSILDSLIDIKNENDTELKLDLDPLERHILFVELEEALTKCEQECTPGTIQNLAGCYQNVRGKEEGTKSKRYEDAIRKAREKLAENFSLWSETGFQMGERDSDDGIIEITERWHELIRSDRAGTIRSGHVRKIAEILADQSVFTSEMGKELLSQTDNICFNMMQSEASKNIELIDRDPEWWKHLEDFYEGNASNNEFRREKIVRLINEGCGRDNQYAKQIMNEILMKNQNRLPQGVSRQSRWNEARRARLNEAIQRMLSRFRTPEDLAEYRLSIAWAEEYSEDYSTSWQELREQADLETAVKTHLENIYSETDTEDRIDFLQALWKIGENGAVADSNGLPKLEQNYVMETLARDYNDLWKEQHKTGRDKLELFADEIQRKRGLGLEKTSAGLARAFLKDYEQETPLELNEIGKRMKELSSKPEWRSWIDWSEYENGNSAIMEVCRMQDISVRGIGLRLIHDMARDQEEVRGAYWKDVVADVMKMRSTNELTTKKIDSADSGKLMNAMSWLGFAAEGLDKAGANVAMTDLRHYLKSVAPGLMSELQDERKRRKYWTNCQEIFPDHLQKLLGMKN